MAHRKTDDEYIQKTHNTARYFVEHPHISWVLLLLTLFWGFYGYASMPQRKDPDIPVRQAMIICPWPVMITVGATIFGLIPLALHGGPLWEFLCYAQIGGLLVATLITLLLVPVFYSIFVMDLKIVTWETRQKSGVESGARENCE
jgi:multidrug efflux pump subunit AcrB